ncbi:MAG TPA: ribosome-associated translation inhibitor RaiA [Kiloniellaceae bacterium]|nr:ribosome-associated translation inhibitor RaiA [Kiloniellaceae bacterium]
MQLSVQGKQLDVGDALRNHIEDRLERTLEKYFGDALEVKVTLTRDAHLYRSVIAAHIGRGIQMEAHGEANEPYPAFDLACDHLSKRLRRHKRRVRQHHKEILDLEALPAQQYILSSAAEDDTDDNAAEDSGQPDQPIVVAEMATNILRLTVSGAVMHLDLTGVPALMFRNSAHGGLNMVYRRQDGNIGWVDPQGNRNQGGPDGAD